VSSKYKWWHKTRWHRRSCSNPGEKKNRPAYAALAAIITLSQNGYCAGWSPPPSGSDDHLKKYLKKKVIFKKFKF